MLDDEGNISQELSFDAWGKRRNPTTWTYYESTSTIPNPMFDRGYTMHEHLDAFKLINMNGRIYDPVIARFLSPDPLIQFPEYSQSYNSYSYVLNNPLRFTDPSGFLVSDSTGKEKRTFGNTIISYALNFLNAIIEKKSESSFSTDEVQFGKIYNNYLLLDDEQVDGSNWVSDAWSWTKDHFYIDAEGEITYGVQLSGIVYKGVGLKINPVSQVVAEGKISNRDSYVISYPIVPATYMDKGKALDFGAAWIVGGNYNWNIVNGKYVSSTFSLGVYGIGGNVTWDKTGVSKLFIGFELGGKVAAGWGANGSAKIGFNWDW